MRHDLLSDVLSAIKNGDQNGKGETTVPFSKLIKDVLMILQKYGYIGDFEYMDDRKGGKFKVQLLGKVNECNSIKPRFYIRKREYDKWEKRYLPSVSMGFLIISTPQGVLIHKDAKERGLGGVLLAFVY